MCDCGSRAEAVPLAELTAVHLRCAHLQEAAGARRGARRAAAHARPRWPWRRDGFHAGCGRCGALLTSERSRAAMLMYRALSRCSARGWASSLACRWLRAGAAMPAALSRRYGCTVLLFDALHTHLSLLLPLQAAWARAVAPLPWAGGSAARASRAARARGAARERPTARRRTALSPSWRRTSKR